MRKAGMQEKEQNKKRTVRERRPRQVTLQRQSVSTHKSLYVHREPL